MGDTKKVSFKAGTFVYVEGDEATEEVYILEQGEVELQGADPRIRQYRSALSAGDIFGFTSALCRRPRMESARTRTDALVVVIPRETFLSLVQANPEMAFRIVSYFAEELRVYNEMVFSLHGSRDYLDGAEALYRLGAYYAGKGKKEHASHVFASYLGRHADKPRADEVRTALESLKAAPAPQPAAQGLYRTFPDGRMIFCEFEPGEELYIVKKGRVKISRMHDGEEVLLSVLREGDIFGELAIVSNKSRNATAVAWGETTLLPISRESLPAVLRASPSIVSRIFLAISQRIWFTYIRLESNLYDNPVTRAYVFLENKLLEDRISLESTRPVTLPFSIEELLTMTGVTADHLEKTRTALLDDANLRLQFKQVTVENPAVLAARAQFHRTRDHLDNPEPAAEARKPAPQPRGRTIGLDPQELRVPPEEIGEKA